MRNDNRHSFSKNSKNFSYKEKTILKSLNIDKKIITKKILLGKINLLALEHLISCFKSCIRFFPLFRGLNDNHI